MERFKKKNNAAYSWSESVHHSLTGREQSPVRYTKQPAAFSRVLNNRGGISGSDSLLHFNFLLSHHYTLFYPASCFYFPCFSNVNFNLCLIWEFFSLSFFLSPNRHEGAQENLRRRRQHLAAPRLEMALQIKTAPTVWCRLVT